MSTRKTLEAEVHALIARMLRVDPIAAGELRRADTERWDSLKHVEIVFALEDAYGVRFEESEFASLDSPSSIAAALRRRLAA